MIEVGYGIGAIVAMTLVTFALRAFPFVAAQYLQRHRIVETLGQFLPPAIMMLLLVHSMLGAARQDASGPWPELLAVAVVVLLQWRRQNALLSILSGTGVYVLMRNFGLV